jgi:elongation factor P--(R)-beta-lysine ligase
MAGLPAFVFAPSDFAAQREPSRRAGGGLRLPARGKRVLVGGRVALVNPGGLVLTDACARLDVAGDALAASIGDLVVARGVFRRGKLFDAVLVERTECPDTRGDGEVARFTWTRAGAHLRQRAQVLSEIRGYFADEAFLEVETPLRVAAPGVDSNVEALRAEGGYLITSPELALKRLLVGGFARVYQLGRVFRAEEAGSLHQPEFTMLEWYRAFAGEDAVMRDTERLIARVARAIRGRQELVTPDGRVLSVKPPFERISVRDAFRKFAGVNDAADLAAADEDRYFQFLVDHVEPGLAALNHPVFLHAYPLSQAALARPSPRDASVAERFELYAGGIELCNGYGELTDAVEQERRFRAERARRKAESRRVYPVDRRFLAALLEGMPAASGNALGVDRLVMLATGAKTIQEVTAFP